MPSMEIVADQVSCTHGATVSDLSPEELFYLQSRGLSKEAAHAATDPRATLADPIADPTVVSLPSLALQAQGGSNERGVGQ